jgi:hypothetical protein
MSEGEINDRLESTNFDVYDKNPNSRHEKIYSCTASNRG